MQDVPYEELQANLRSVRMALSGRVPVPWNEEAITSLAEQMYWEGSMPSGDVISAYQQRIGAAPAPTAASWGTSETPAASRPRRPVHRLGGPCRRGPGTFP